MPGFGRRSDKPGDLYWVKNSPARPARAVPGCWGPDQKAFRRQSWLRPQATGLPAGPLGDEMTLDSLSCHKVDVAAARFLAPDIANLWLPAV
jgi:hypothetical protein